MAPASAGAAIIGLGLEDVRPFGRFWIDKSEMGLGMVGFIDDGLVVLLVLRVKHFVLSTAIVAIVVVAI